MSRTTTKSGANSDARLPRYLVIRDDIARRIADGGWSFQDPIPSETKLAEQYGTALGTVRRAIDELVREGWLDRRHGSGTYIRRSDFSGSLSRFLRFRSSHSTIAFQESRVLSAKRCKPPATIQKALAVGEGKNAIQLDRRRYHDGDLLVTEDIWVPAERFEALLDLSLDDIGPLLYRTYEETCGVVIASAQEALRITAASDEIADTLGTGRGSIVIVIDRTSFDHSGAAVEWRRSHAVADHFEYRIEIR